MHPHNPRSEAREVEGVRFEPVTTSSTRWTWRDGNGNAVTARWSMFAGEWKLETKSSGYIESSANARLFAHAIGAAAKLADELNERKEPFQPLKD